MRKLSKQYLAVLLLADTHGQLRPGTKEMIDACIALAAYEYLGEHDGSPGSYFITAAGETKLAKDLRLKSAA